MDKLEKQIEIDRIRKLPPEEFYKQSQMDERLVMSGTEEESDAEFGRWALYIACATDLQLYFYIKNEYSLKADEYGPSYLEVYVDNMLKERDRYQKKFGVSPQKREKGLVTDTKKLVEDWTTEIRKLYTLHKFLKENPEVARKEFENSDFAHRA